MGTVGGGGKSGTVKQLNVGGKLFSLEASSLSLSLSLDSPSPTPTFVDRDPALLSAVLAAIRAPSSAAPAFPARVLLDEAHFYGLHAQLLAALSPPPLRGFSVSLASTLSPASEPFPTAFAPHHDGSLCLAHGAGQVTYYSPALDHLSTFRTHLHRITSLQQLPPGLVVLGSASAPGLHVYDYLEGRHVASVQWSDPTDTRCSKAKVVAIAACPADAADKNSPILATFECPHRENCILVVDPVTLKPMQEIGRQSGSAAKSSTPCRVVHLPAPGLVFASFVSSGAFGYSGYMRLWDIRSGNVVWETSEPGGAGRSSRFGDPFADADVDVKQQAIYKVCSKSGDVAVADLRSLGNDPWAYMSSGPRGSGGGYGSVLHCHQSQVFVSRKDGLEVWSRLGEQLHDTGDFAEQSGTKEGPRSEGIDESFYRSCYVDTEEDAKRGMIQMMAGGGDRLFLTRENMQGVEVWETSHLAGAVSL
ncbi:hypothetical protein SETIT_9G456700v2 [Setaria italica]|uniref:Potassium channel tetramerisation-type BTB domain-containing protein n=1 Tax=Setaria italica TaxID=4555 RepID=K4A9C6_SETIT|nr:BTB/POZ domain-containing protein At3g09030 [Setaria italica]RCV45469.1 hypothetical protein SETIT_9G456700v2 [Setaria italica]